METTSKNRLWPIFRGATFGILTGCLTGCLPGRPIALNHLEAQAPIGHEFFAVHAYDLGVASRVEGNLESEHRDSGTVEIEVIRSEEIIQRQSAQVHRKLGRTRLPVSVFQADFAGAILATDQLRLKYREGTKTP